MKFEDRLRRIALELGCTPAEVARGVWLEPPDPCSPIHNSWRLRVGKMTVSILPSDVGYAVGHWGALRKVEEILGLKKPKQLGSQTPYELWRKEWETLRGVADG